LRTPLVRLLVAFFMACSSWTLYAESGRAVNPRRMAS
jgi:hypothetical protein